MNTQEINPPQPIPYPDKRFIKKFYRTPILLYRLGLGFLIGKYILILSTFGRMTGKIHRTPVEYFQYQGRVYIMSGFGDRPDWYKNLQAAPLASLNIKNKSLRAKARQPHSEAEWDGVIAFLKSSPVAQLSAPTLYARLEEKEVREAIKKWPVMMFDLTDESCPAPLDADLTWTWPLVFFAAASILLLGWLRQRRS